MAWFRCGSGSSGGGGGFTWDTLLYKGVVYDGGERTVSCPDIMDYDYIYVVVIEDLHVRGLDSHMACKCIKTSDLTNDYNTMIGYLYGATNVYIKIVNKNSVNCYYSNNQKIYCNVYGSNTNLFDVSS